MKLSDHYNGKRFTNAVPTTVSRPGTFWNNLWQFLTATGERTPLLPPGPFGYDPADWQAPPSPEQVRVCWLGHSTLILEAGGKRFLTDPVWAKRASPYQFAGPARFFDAPIPLAALPKLDGLLLSHDHYDHLDERAIRQLAPSGIPVYCPLGVDRHLRKWGVTDKQLHVFDWWDELVLDEHCTLIAAPARHFSGRGLFDKDRTLWASWILLGQAHRVYFGGDSGFHPGFAEIGRRFGPFDLTILEIGAYHENWPDIHMGPENALMAHEALRGKVLLPVHWGTFNLALHPWREPAQRLLAGAGARQIPLWMPAPGQAGVLPPEGFLSNWWL